MLLVVNRDLSKNKLTEFPARVAELESLIGL